jgi:hypothetical protein
MGKLIVLKRILLCLCLSTPLSGIAADASFWVLDWGGKTVNILNKSDPLLGVRVLRQNHGLQVGGQIYTLEADVDRHSSLSMVGAYVAYETRVLKHMAIASAVSMNYSDSIEAMPRKKVGFVSVEPSINLVFYMNEWLNLVVGEGYMVPAKDNHVREDWSFSIFARFLWK